MVKKSSIAKKKILKKPSVKGFDKLSAQKAVAGIATSTGPLVREVENREVEFDDRSLFFKKEMDMERRGLSKWI